MVVPDGRLCLGLHAGPWKGVFRRTWLLCDLPVLSWCVLWAVRSGVLLSVEAPSVTEKGTRVSLELRRTGGWMPTGPVSVRLVIENTVTGERIQKVPVYR